MSIMRPLSETDVRSGEMDECLDFSTARWMFSVESVVDDSERKPSDSLSEFEQVSFMTA